MQKILVPLLFPLILLTGCNSRQTPPDVVSFLTLKGPSAMGMIYLIDSPSGMIGKPLRIEIIDEPMQVRARMLKDKPELAVLPLNMGAILYNKGLDYQVIAIPVWGTLYLTGSDTSITGWQSLKNKRVYLMGKGTTPDIVFRYLLSVHQLKPDEDITLDYSFPTHIDLANAVAAGKAGIAVISEPLASLSRMKNPGIHQMIDLNEAWSEAFPGRPDMPQTALMGRKDFIRNHPGWIRQIGESWLRSIAQVNDYPQEAAARIVHHNILPDREAAVNSIPGCNLKFRYAADITREIEQYLQVLFIFNPDAVGGKLPDEKFICPKPDY